MSNLLEHMRDQYGSPPTQDSNSQRPQQDYYTDNQSMSPYPSQAQRQQQASMNPSRARKAALNMSALDAALPDHNYSLNQAQSQAYAQPSAQQQQRYQIPPAADRLLRAPSQPPLTVPLRTDAQAQPAVCTTLGTIQVSPAEEGEQEATSEPSNITLDMSSNSDLVEECNQRRDVSLAISIAREPDKSCPTEGCHRSFNPSALRPSSQDNPTKSTEPSNIRLVHEATDCTISSYK